jgi:hypothetical protein
MPSALSQTGRRKGIGGIARLHGLIDEQLGEDDEPAPVVVGIETDRGPWVQALTVAGYHGRLPCVRGRLELRRFTLSDG